MEETTLFNFRIPNSLKEKLEKLAESEHRSMTGHVLYLIEKDLKEHNLIEYPAPTTEVK